MVRTRFVVLPLLAALLLSTASAQTTDLDILNLTLQLECLEAEFFSFAAFGTGVNGTTSVGGRKATLSATAQSVAEELAVDEVTHLNLLRAYVRGIGEPADCPTIDLGTAFATAMDAALNTTLNPPYSPYSNDIAFYLGAFMFEDLVVKAYNSAVEALSERYLVTAAAGLLGAEAYHAGVIRTVLAANLGSVVTPYNLPLATAAQAVADITLSQGLLLGADLADAIGLDAGSLNLIPVDENAAVEMVDAETLLSVAYLGGNFSGGFFPNGLNGAASASGSTGTAV